MYYHIGEKRNAYKALVGKPEGRRPLRRPRHRWEGWYVVVSSDSGFVPVMGSCEHGEEPSGSMKCWNILE
jgi:hypothetical protein